LTMPVANSDPVYWVQPWGVVLPSLPVMHAPPFDDCGVELAVHDPALLLLPPELPPPEPLLLVLPPPELPLLVLLPPSSLPPLAPELEVPAPPSAPEPPPPPLLLEQPKAVATMTMDPNVAVMRRLMVSLCPGEGYTSVTAYRTRPAAVTVAAG
jgi:hypothetical protein